MGKSWESQKKVMKKSWESSDKVLRKSWENCEKVVRKYVIRKLWENGEKVMRKLWESHHKVVRNSWESHQKLRAAHYLKFQSLIIFESYTNFSKNNPTKIFLKIHYENWKKFEIFFFNFFVQDVARDLQSMLKVFFEKYQHNFECALSVRPKIKTTSSFFYWFSGWIT